MTFRDAVSGEMGAAGVTEEDLENGKRLTRRMQLSDSTERNEGREEKEIL